MTSKNNKAPLLYYIKLCASFQIHSCIKTGVTVRKPSIRVKIGDFFVPRDLENGRMTLKNNRARLLCCFNPCASFHSHWWIHTGVTVRKHPIWVKIDDFFSRVTLKFDRWLWRNRVPLLSNIKLCASFRHMWIQTGVTVRKWLKKVMTSVTLTFDLWPWPFACTPCLSMVITPENVRMIWW